MYSLLTSNQIKLEKSFVVSLKGKILSSNKECLSVLNKIQLKVEEYLPDDLYRICLDAFENKSFSQVQLSVGEEIINLNIVPDEEKQVLIIYGEIKKAEKEEKLKQIEKALTESEEKYRILVESASDIIYTCDIEGYFTFANKIALELVEFDNKELQKTNYLDIIREDYKPAVKAFYRRQFDQLEKSTYLEFPFKSKSGKEMWVGQHVKNIIKNGEIAGIQAVARIITERVLAEQQQTIAERKLKDSKANLEAIIENTEDAILSINKNYEVTAVNSTFLKNYILFQDSKIEEGDLILKKFDGRRSKYKPHWKIYYNEAFKGNSFKIEEKYTIENNDYFYELSFHPIFSEETKVVGVSIFAANITDLKKNEQELKEQQANLKAIIENTEDLVLSIDNQYKLLVFNSSFRKSVFSLYQIEPRKGMNILHLTGSDTEHRWKRYFDRVLQGDAFKIEESDMADGNEVFYEVAFNPIISEKNKITGASVISRNITGAKRKEIDLKKISSRLISLIQNLQSAILVEDEKGKLVYVNKKYFEFFGVPLEPEPMAGLSGAQSAERSKKLFKEPNFFVNRVGELLTDKVIVTNEEVEMKDGRILERDYIPIFVKGDYTGHLWQYRDITERKRAEKELIKARMEAFESMKAKDQFLSVMSHEIRTPMNAVVGMTHLLLQENPTREQIEYLNSIKYSAENLLVIINDILDFNKIESGKISFEEIDFELNEILVSVYKTLIFKVEEKNLKLKINWDENVPLVLKGDPVRLNQILLNLISNAVKFTEKGYVIIDVKFIEKKGDKSMVMFKISDTGIGIAADKINIIFESFTQSSSDTTRKYGGTGLGLTITKKLVEYMGGTIDVNSELGKGSSFEVILPIKNSELKVLVKEPQINNINDSLKGIRILLAEDNKMNQVVAKKFLIKWGATVEVAENGVEALEKFYQNEFHLILMDLQMPELDGYETTKIIRTNKGKKGKNIPIIALTASALLDVKTKVLAAGMNDYVTKPFDPYHLFEKVAIHTLKKMQFNVDNTGEEKAISFDLPDTHLIDLTYLKEISGGNNDFIMEMIALFVSNTPENMQKIRKEFEKRNFKEVKAVAHKLKANLKMMGIGMGIKLIEDIEKYATWDKNEYLLGESIEKLEVTCQEALQNLTEKIIIN